MDEATEDRLKGMLKRIIVRYDRMEGNLEALEEDVKLIRKDMLDAAILLRDKQTWRLEEIDREIGEFAERMEDG